MSYILDALKKSEQENKKGQVPGLGTVQGLPGPGGRFETDRLIWIYGLATLLIAALGVGAWLFLREPAPAPVEEPPVAIAQLPEDSKAAPPPTAEPAPVPFRAEPEPAAAPPTSKLNRPTVPQPPTARTATPRLLKKVVPAPAASSSPIAPVAPVTPVAPTPLVEKALSSPAQVEETAPERPAAGESGNEESEAPVKPELLPTVPFEELPAETRAEMPTIKIGLHLFSDTPASRRASINGRLVREGQAVDKDLVLVEIIRQGVILSYQGRKFTMPVFPR